MTDSKNSNITGNIAYLVDLTNTFPVMVIESTFCLLPMVDIY